MHFLTSIFRGIVWFSIEIFDILLSVILTTLVVVLMHMEVSGLELLGGATCIQAR